MTPLETKNQVPNNMGAGGMQSAATMTSALAPVSSLSQNTDGHCFDSQNPINISSGQVLVQNVLVNAQTQMQTRQQQHQQQLSPQQQSHIQHQLLQQQLQQKQAIFQQRLQQQSQNGSSMLQQPQHQLMQNQQLVQRNQLPLSQQSILQAVQPPFPQSSQQSLLQHSQSSVTEKSLLQQKHLSELQPQPQPQPQPQHSQQLQPVLSQSNLKQQELQSRLDCSSGSFQQLIDDSIEHQKQLLQVPSHMMSDAATTNMESARTGQTTVTKMQERIYQRMQVLKERYLLELKVFRQKLQLISMQPIPPEQLHIFEQYKDMANHTIDTIQLPRGSFPETITDKKLDALEKEIQNLISESRSIRPALQNEGTQQILPQTRSWVQSIQQSQHQIPQMHQEMHVNHPHSSTQMLHQSGLETSQQNIRTAMQTVGNLNSYQGTGVGIVHQSSASSLQHNYNSYALQHNNSAIQQNSINSLKQSYISTVQNNINPVQSNVNASHHHQAMKQQEMLQGHWKIMLAQEQHEHRQPQDQLQPKQQQAVQMQTQFQAQQMPQLPHISNMSIDVKLKQAATVDQRLMQQNHSLAQHPVFQQQQQKQFNTDAPLSVSSLPFLFSSPQPCQQFSPQMGHQNLAVSPVQVQSSKVETPLQQMTSEDAENQSSALSSITNVGCDQRLQHPATAMEPTVSAAFLIKDKSSTESPFQHLIKVINRTPHEALASTVNDIGSVASLVDMIPGSAPGNGSRAAIREDLAATTKSHLQARILMSQDGNAARKKMKHNSIPLTTVSSGVTVTNPFQPCNNVESLEIKSTATSRINRPRLVSHVLQNELQEICKRLIDTVVEINEEDDDYHYAALRAEQRDGVVLKCYYNAKALSPNMKACYRSSQVAPISPLHVLVPADYPETSPILMDKCPSGSCKEYADLSSRAREKFHTAMQTLPQPTSIMALARTWDESARSAVVEYACQSGGGSFSSYYGPWESCTNA